MRSLLSYTKIIGVEIPAPDIKGKGLASSCETMGNCGLLDLECK